jgi:hypothetical protein
VLFVIQMREYILTDNERTIIHKYIETSERLEGFAVLVNRCQRMQVINDDLELIKQFLSKVGQK